MKIYQEENLIQRLAIISVIVFVFAQTIAAQTTAFNFQGRLNDGSSPANGSYDLQFRLYDAITGGNLIGTPITKLNTILINGVFGTQFDFGTNAFNGADRFIEIRLHPAGSENGYVILGARQQIMSVPYAVKSLNSSNADNAANATNAVNSQQLGGAAASQFVQKDASGNVALGDGNITQSQNGFGTPKAMLSVGADGTIRKCFNSTTGAATNRCGFTVTHFTEGGYGINFGFSVLSRIVFVTAHYRETASSSKNMGANYGYTASQNALNVFTFLTDSQNATDDDFMIILF